MKYLPSSSAEEEQQKSTASWHCPCLRNEATVPTDRRFGLQPVGRRCNCCFPSQPRRPRPSRRDPRSTNDSSPDKAFRLVRQRTQNTNYKAPRPPMTSQAALHASSAVQTTPWNRLEDCPTTAHPDCPHRLPILTSRGAFSSDEHLVMQVRSVAKEVVTTRAGHAAPSYPCFRASCRSFHSSAGPS